jgi:uncharacterized protein
LNPIHFGSGARRLFGLYTPARTVGSGGRAIVLCHPWGQEYLRAHRSVRQLSAMLAGAGFHVFRFDYYGTGDSYGLAADGDLAGWKADIESAVEELRDTSGATRVALAGLRLGATLAASVAAEHPELIDSLVLWDPVISGPEYLSELLQKPSAFEVKRGSVLPRRIEDGSGWEVRGFLLTQGLADEIAKIDLVQLVGKFPEKSLILASQPQPSHALLQSALASHNRPASMESIEAAPAWLEERNLGAGAIPVKLLHRVVDWLD